MNFVVKFSVMNAAFDDDRNSAIVQVLSEVQRRIDLGYEAGDVIDVNGNVIGEFGLRED